MLGGKSSKYSVGQRVLLNSGRLGKVVGVNPIDGTYQIMTSDNKSLRVKSGDIEKIAAQKSANYQESGVDLENSSELSIKDTPFDIDK
jgi:hypothetical protein